MLLSVNPMYKIGTHLVSFQSVLYKENRLTESNIFPSDKLEAFTHNQV